MKALTRKADQSPFGFFNGIEKDLDLLFDPFFKGNWEVQKEGNLALNLYESDEDYVVEAKLPGFQKDEVTVHLDRDVVTIEAEHKSEKKSEKYKKVYEEFDYSKVSRSVKLPWSFEAKDVKANYEHGNLTITIPKQKAAAKQIPIK